MSLFKRLQAASAAFRGSVPAPAAVLTSARTPDDERGRRTTPENALKYMYRLMWVDPELRATILEIRDMDYRDGRVKKIHSRMAMDTVRGGLTFTQGEESAELAKRWREFARRTSLSNAVKLKSDARAFVLSGNLPTQWVLDQGNLVVGAVAMPAETMLPNVSPAGRFIDPTRAYIQMDVMTGAELAAFPLWKMTMGRLDPESFDDMGAMGRPLLDAVRETWRKLRMTEEDLVIRRRTRAPLRMSHVLEGASVTDIDDYRKRVEQDQNTITTDYYANKKGGVTAVQGDSAVDQIADVVHLLDTFFAGTPLPAGLMGYVGKINRDILADLMNAYFDEIDVVQDTLAWVYEQGFRLELLLDGINPDQEEFTIKFAERRTETPNQTADRLLKWNALGIPPSMVWEEMGKNPEDVLERKEQDAERYNPYPDEDGTNPAATGAPRVAITPGNAPKGESATSISNNGGA